MRKFYETLKNIVFIIAAIIGIIIILNFLWFVLKLFIDAFGFLSWLGSGNPLTGIGIIVMVVFVALLFLLFGY